MSTLIGALSALDIYLPNSLLAYTCVGALLLVAAHLIPWVIDQHGLRKHHIPGPFLAQVSSFWLPQVAATRRKAEVLHGLHQTYGQFVRIAPNHVSISNPEAVPILYGHGTGTLKSDFYDPFVSIRTGVFNTRNRAEHARKRRIIAHIFSQQRILEFEAYILSALGKLVTQWDSLANNDLELESHRLTPNVDGAVRFDCMKWFNYLAFDIIGDLAFGETFGMVDAGADRVAVAVHDDRAANLDAVEKNTNIVFLPAIKVINDRGEYAATMGCLPAWARPLTKVFPWYAKGSQAVKSLSGVAIAAIDKRLATHTERPDLLTYLQRGKDEEGQSMGRSELISEALTQLAAGSDTVSNTSCAITYWLCRHPAAQKTLQKELDEILGESDALPTYEQIKRLPYLNAAINEGLRIHTTSASGLPRVMPSGGLEICGMFFPEGVVCSVSMYTIHRDPAIWGQDVEVYRPERWFEQDAELIQKTFNPFSLGPRGCVGKNLASMELLLIIATIFHRYELCLMKPEQLLDVREGFSRKPVSCEIAMKRRRV